MAKAYTFTTKHYPVNDLLALDLQDHLDQMVKLGLLIFKSRGIAHSKRVYEFLLTDNGIRLKPLTRDTIEVSARKESNH